jgi:acyl-CoA thioester hydrolase
VSDASPRDLTRADFDALDTVTTRWADNDMFGHLNNAVYLELFDTVLNAWMMRGTGIDERTAPVQGLVVESSCRYYAEVAFPGPLEIGVRVARIGRTSAVVEFGLFVPGDPAVRAHGEWAQVYVDAETRRPTPIPDAVRAFFEATVAGRETTTTTRNVGEKRAPDV